MGCIPIGSRWTAVGVALVLSSAFVACSGEAGPEKVPREVLLVAAATSGPDPFTPPVDPVDPATLIGVRPQSGTVPAAGAPLYGGSGDRRVCDVDALITYLEGNADKAAAWAETLGISAGLVAQYVRASLTPSVLLYDTRVTNHGFANGRATSFQAILEAGSAVLVDFQGQPRVKCKCGNPLTPPIRAAATARYAGPHWRGFQPGVAVTVATLSPTDVTPPVDAPPGAGDAVDTKVVGRIQTTLTACRGYGIPTYPDRVNIKPDYAVATTDEPGVYQVTVTFPAEVQERERGPWTFTVDTTKDRWPATGTNEEAEKFAGTCNLVEDPGAQWFSNLKAITPKETSKTSAFDGRYQATLSSVTCSNGSSYTEETPIELTVEGPKVTVVSTNSGGVRTYTGRVESDGTFESSSASGGSSITITGTFDAAGAVGGRWESRAADGNTCIPTFAGVRV